MPNIGAVLQSLRAGLVIAEGILVLHAHEIQSPWDWIIGGIIAIGVAMVSELIAGMNAKEAHAKLAQAELTLGSHGLVRMTEKEKKAKAKEEVKGLPWWWDIIVG